MLEELFDAAVSTSHEQERMRLIRQMVNSPDEIVPVALEALHKPPPLRGMIAIAIFHELGYPTNAPAIPELIIHLGDPNRLGWDVVVKTLEEIGPDVVVPYLVPAILDQGRTNEYWRGDIEGLCFMLKQVDSAFARRCCPAINYLLSQANLATFIDFDFLLGALEKAGNDQTYVLPTLFDLRKTTTSKEITEHVQHIIASFPGEALTPYQGLETP